MPLLRPLLDLLLRFPDRCQPLLAPLQLCRDVQLHLLLGRLAVGSLAQLQQPLHLALQLLLQLVGMAPAHRFVLARVALNLAPVQAHRPQPHDPQRRRQHQDLREQPFQFIQKPLAEVRYRVMVRMPVGADVAERHRIVGRLLQLAAGEHSRRVAVEQQRHQQRRMIGVLAATSVLARDFAQIKLVYDFYDKARQMLFGQPFLNRRWHEHRRIAIDGPEYR